MDFSNFSLLYPENLINDAEKRPDIDGFELEELGLDEIFNLKNRELSEFVTSDPEVMRYRLETFSDMLENDGIAETLNRLIPILSDILELRRLDVESGDTNSYLSSITEIELYISSIDTLNEGFSALGGKIKGRALSKLAKRISELANSDYYSELNEKLAELTNRVRDIKSVTIGVNLDAQLRPSSAGVLSINPETFRSGDVMEKILRLNFKDDEYTCIAELVPFGKKQNENQKTALSLAFTSAINDVYKSSLRSWKKIVQAYVLENTDFLLNLLPEIEFFVKGTELLKKLKDRGLPLAVPDIKPMSERAFTAKDIYNPRVALKAESEIVFNDIAFDENASIYVLTGPNRGGKSVITCAVGMATVMAQLGMFVPAKSAVISPVDALFTHFPTGAEDTIDKGRLGEECDRLRGIFDLITENSLVLMDESFSSTGAYEASYIASEVLAALSHVGCRCIFSTHLHQLASEVEALNKKAKKDGGAPIDTLVAAMETGQRSFRILRKKPDGKSYARDIAEKYGITYDDITKNYDKRKEEK